MVKIREKRGKFNVSMKNSELNTIAIALALLSLEDLENEAKEQGLNISEIQTNYFSLFDQFTEVNGLYPKQVIDKEPLVEVSTDDIVKELDIKYKAEEC